MNTILKLSWYGIILLWLLQSCTAPAKITPATALENYLRNDDNTFKWEIDNVYESDQFNLYDLHLVSQNWRGHEWSHQLSVLVPEVVEHDEALLFISGGSNKKGEPNWKQPDDSNIKMMSMIAQRNNALVAVLFQVPNQPLYNDLTEDELISFTFHNFRNDKDYSWPLLFPMVKSAVKAMDAIQEFSKETLDRAVKSFLVSGASKRGWTTWLTGAQDKRVQAIAPMVIDMLNMPASIKYHLEAWGSYSIQIQDYVNLGIAQDVDTPDGQDLVAMVDPYSYRSQLTMPKLIFNGTNDEYWPVDAIKHYIDDIPGDNYLHYVPNAGHGLGDKQQAIQALNSFFGIMLNGENYPVYSWELEAHENELIFHIKNSDKNLAGVNIWTSESYDRDFRDNKFIREKVHFQNQEELDITVSFPDSGYRAFYVELIYPDQYGELFSLSTRMYVIDSQNLY